MKRLLSLILLIGAYGFDCSAYQGYDQNLYPIRRCCTDASSNWYNAGPDRAWREENIGPDNFSIYRRSDFRPVSFTDLSEQPQISGFETSVYTSPK